MQREYINTTPYCRYELLLNIIKHNDNTSSINTINKIKEILIEKYNLDKSLNGIVKTFITQNKKLMAIKLYNKKVTLETTIMSDNYYISDYDIILLAEKLKLPIILLTSKKFKENNKSILVLNKSDKKNYYFIEVLPSKKDIPNAYRLFIFENNILINQESLGKKSELKHLLIT